MLQLLNSFYRNFKSNPFHNWVNLAGLSFSICSALFVLFFIYYESTFDTYHEKADRIYRITSKIVSPTSQDHVAWSPMELAGILKTEYPQVESYTRLKKWEGDVWCKTTTKSVKVDRLYSTDETLFDVFSYRLITGNPSEVLRRPASVVLSQSLAEKIFDADPIGEVITFNDRDFEVTGIMNDVDPRSDIRADAFVSFSTEEEERLSWAITYLLFSDVQAGASFQGLLNREIEKSFKPEFRKAGADIFVYMEPLSSLHFVEQHMFDGPKGNRLYLYLFEALAFFIMALGAINYINISIALSIRRSKEIGVRRSLGASRYALLVHFLKTGVCFVFIAFVAGFILFNLLRGIFFDISSITINPEFIAEPGFFGILLLSFVVIVFFSALYPSIYISKLDPAQNLSGERSAKIGVRVRKWLLSFQFAFSLVVVILTGIVARQTSFMLRADPGFQKEATLIFQLPREERALDMVSPLRDAWKSQSVVKSVSFCAANAVPGRDYEVDVFELETSRGFEQRTVSNISVDSAYLQLLNIRLLDGNYFSARSLVTDSIDGEPQFEFIVNMALVRAMEWETAIDKEIRFKGGPGGRVVGVIGDFNYKSLHTKVEPMIIVPLQYPETALVKVTSVDAQSLSTLRDVWLDVTSLPGGDPQTLEDFYSMQYGKEQTIISVLTFFSVVMIITAYLGIFALSSLIISQTSKDIAIRKVYGGTTASIGLFLLGKLLSPLGVSIPVAFIASFLIGSYWIESFQYRTTIGAGIYLGALIGVGVVVSTILVYTIVQSDRIKPVEMLRKE